MVVATCLFSRLMGDIQDMLRAYSSAEAELAEQMEGIVAFLRSSRVPAALQQRIRAWAGFKIAHDRADARLKEVGFAVRGDMYQIFARSLGHTNTNTQVMSMLPDNLRQGVAMSVNTSIFRRVLLFQKVRSSQIRLFSDSTTTTSESPTAAALPAF